MAENPSLETGAPVSKLWKGCRSELTSNKNESRFQNRSVVMKGCYGILNVAENPSLETGAPVSTVYETRQEGCHG